MTGRRPDNESRGARGQERRYVDLPDQWTLVESEGIGPFETKMAFERVGGERVAWESRRHRKGHAMRRSDSPKGAERGHRWLVLWAPRHLSWWVAVTYVLGSVLFAVGAVASLAGGAPLLTGAAYFAGSAVFTVGVYAQLLESVNSVDRLGARGRRLGAMRWLAWQPHRLSYVTAALFLLGTVLYDVETAIVLAEALGWLEIGAPLGVLSLVGSALFVGGGYLLLAEVCHRSLCVRARSLSWWSSLLSAVGCVGFLVGAVSGVSVPGLSSFGEPIVVALAYLCGSGLFLVGSYLTIPETFSE